MDTPFELEQMLQNLRNAQEAVAAMTEKMREVSVLLIPPEVKERIAECEAELQPLVDAASKNAAAAEATVRAWVLEHQAGGKAAGLEATYTAGRTTWDTKGLDKATKLIPALADYRKTGDPYVTIRKAKDEA